MNEGELEQLVESMNYEREKDLRMDWEEYMLYIFEVNREDVNECSLMQIAETFEYLSESESL